jgi:hypothetical protein
MSPAGEQRRLEDIISPSSGGLADKRIRRFRTYTSSETRRAYHTKLCQNNVWDHKRRIIDGERQQAFHVWVDDRHLPTNKA